MPRPPAIAILLGAAALSACYDVPYGRVPASTCTYFSSTVTVPASVPATPAPTVVAVTGLPPTTVSWAGFTVSGTPAWNDFGDWSVAAKGTVPGAPLYRPSTWSGSGTLAVALPGLTPTPASFTILPGEALSDTVIVTVTPPCAYVLTYTWVPIPNNTTRFLAEGSVWPATVPETTSVAGTIALQVQDEGVPGTGTLNLWIASRAPGQGPATVSIPINRQ